MNWRNKQEQLDRQPGNGATRFEEMNRAVGYLEQALDGPDIHRAARIARCSVYHFQRIFSYLAGISLFDYLRRRRLTLAAFALQKGRPVLEVALEYGYESPEAFARAFRRMHGMAPSQAKTEGASLRVWPRIYFHITRQGEMDLEYHIEAKPAFRLFGADTWISTEKGEQDTAISAFWRQCRENGAMERIRTVAGIGGEVPLHAAIDRCTDAGYRYLIGTHCESNPSREWALLEVPAASWAVFPTGELSMEAAARELAVLWKRIFIEWFPTSGYELAEAPELELHHRRGDDLFQNEIWIPIRKQ